jgi:hypothetical protein
MRWDLRLKGKQLSTQTPAWKQKWLLMMAILLLCAIFFIAFQCTYHNDSLGYPYHLSISSISSIKMEFHTSKYEIINNETWNSRHLSIESPYTINTSANLVREVSRVVYDESIIRLPSTYQNLMILEPGISTPSTPRLVSIRPNSTPLSISRFSPENQNSYIYLPIVMNQISPRYFVAPNGDDSAPGTWEHPWRTIQKAANSLNAGETVVILTGDYDERVIITRSGAPSQPIVYIAEGTVSMKGFTVYADYITLRGFNISDTDNHNQNGWGIFVEGSYCVIEENNIHDATRGGIALWASPGNYDDTKNCIVRGNHLYRNAFAGIEVKGMDNLIESNEIWGTIQYHPKWENPPVWADADGIRFHGSGHVIRNNYIHDIHYSDPGNVNPHIDCFQTFSISDAERAQNVILEKNICKNVEAQTSEEFGKGFMLEGAYDVLIRNNIIEAFNNININTACNAITIVNNVFTSDLDFVMEFDTVGIAVRASPNTIIKNNIFYDLPNHIIVVYDSTSQQGLDVGYNIAYRSDGKPPWGDPYPDDLWQVNPLFIDPYGFDYHLLPSSPAIDAGTILNVVQDDFDGITRPQGSGYDIGAFEYLP